MLRQGGKRGGEGRGGSFAVLTEGLGRINILAEGNREMEMGFKGLLGAGWSCRSDAEHVTAPRDDQSTGTDSHKLSSQKMYTRPGELLSSL